MVLEYLILALKARDSQWGEGEREKIRREEEKRKKRKLVKVFKIKV